MQVRVYDPQSAPERVMRVLEVRLIDPGYGEVYLEGRTSGDWWGILSLDEDGITLMDDAERCRLPTDDEGRVAIR